MSNGLLRLLIAGTVLFLLLRSAVGAWRNRALALAIWQRVTWRHVGGATVLLVGVATLGTVLLMVPPLQVGLGNVLGFVGNIVFAPLEEAAVRAGPAPATGPDWVFAVMATVFLGFLAVLLPWLAFVEEEIFRAGLEVADLKAELWSALRFGLAHLVMFVPLGAALAIGAAGFVYGRIYRRGVERAADGVDLPPVVRGTFRQSRAARRASRVVRLRETRLLPAVEDPPFGWAPLTLLPPEHDPRDRQAAGVLTSTVWHATFNSLIVGLLWLGIVAESLL